MRASPNESARKRILILLKVTNSLSSELRPTGLKLKLSDTEYFHGNTTEGYHPLQEVSTFPLLSQSC